MASQTVRSDRWQGVWDTPEPGDDAPNLLTAGLNGYLTDPGNGSPFHQRPAVTLLNGGVDLDTTVGQAVYEHEAWSGTRYIFAFCDGKVYRANTAAMAAWTDVTPANVILSTTAKIGCTSLNDELIVSDGVNKPWRGTSLSSSPIVATMIEYDGPTPEQIAGTGGIPSTTAEAILSIGSTDVRLANAAFTYTYRAGGSLGQQASFAANAVGTAVGALGQIAIGTWGAIRVELNTSTGALVFTASFDGGAGYATEALAVAAVAARTATYWDLGFVAVQADVAAVWIAGTDAFAGGSTGNQAQTTHYYAGEGSPWNHYGPIGVYQGSLVGILGQVATVYARATFAWSEPNDASTGFAQTGYDDVWSLTQTDASALTSLTPTNAGIYYGRALSWGMLDGTLSVDISNSATSDAISENIGTTAPWTVDQYGNYIYFADAQGRPNRFQLGDGPEQIWQAMAQAADNNRQGATALGQLASAAWGIIEPNLNVYLFGFPTATSGTGYAPTTFYCFDGPTGRYNGTWTFAGGEAMATGGIVHDANGVPVLVMLGTNGGTNRTFVWKLTVPTDYTWQDNGAQMSVYAQTHRMGYGYKTQQTVTEVRACCGIDTPTTATTITTNGITTWGPAAPVGVTLLSRGTTDTRVASLAFGYLINGTAYTKAAVAAGTAFSAQTIPLAKWGSYRMSVNTAGTLTLTAAPDNTTGYATEAAAIDDVPAVPLNEWNVGYLTVQAQSGNNWIAATDALQGGTTGNEAQTTNYYAGETSFDGTYVMTFKPNQCRGRGVQVQIAPDRTYPAASAANQGQWVLYGVEADLVSSQGAADQR